VIAIPSDAKIFVHRNPTDMRKSFDGLTGLVRSEFGREPSDGSLFLFINRRQDRIKILRWDKDGYELWYKRLEAGTFERIERGNGHAVQLDATELSMILGGVAVANAKRRKRYREAA
jgi:transposase